MKYYVDGVNDKNSPFDFDEYEWIDEIGAERASEDYYNNHDGWEDNYPITLTLISEDGKTEKSFKIEMEAIPTFYANPI
jgi:regulatory protein YycH of two-component signal transduction system YycFG